MNILPFIETLGFISPVTLTTIAIFLAVTSFAWFVMMKVGGDDQAPAESRLERLKTTKRGIRDIAEEEKQKSKNEALTEALEKAATPIASSVSGNEEEMGKLREKLVNAGFRRESAPIIFKMIQLVCTGIGLLLGGVTGAFVDGLTQGMIMKLLIGMIVGFMLPSLILGFMASKRREKIFLGLPDALDLMVVCVEAGLGLDQALRKVAEEMQKSHKAIGEEFSISNHQLQLGRPRSEVLSGLGYRSGVDDLKQLASILIQADKFGSSVAQALRVQSDSMRTKRRQIAEEKAAKTAVKMIFPLVLFIFPGIFVVLVGPAAINMYRQMLQ
ncbi:type II secretion system F family protein [Rhodopirellula sp. JC740]|uniref:Type II secretion system F family protein n=1 Tax=Rhodopirellula halodulae TaxID=2894198 RepID=A0ABS8NM85_9BACT|nr:MULTISPECIES: type II secretion system F family protein [unclassified Rhodopirellula]MCC9644625.1 type II secretion system F family protein [Rhodopirellula sp. JC740]MCC9658055.1 type II secretion system F family protein [Rhodopirellula sp. JC737]